MDFEKWLTEVEEERNLESLEEIVKGAKKQ